MNVRRVTADARGCAERTVENYRIAMKDGVLDRAERRTHEANLTDLLTYARAVDANDRLQRGIGRCRSPRQFGDLVRVAIEAADELPEPMTA